MIKILRRALVYFDVDDTLWPLTRRVSQDLKIPFERFQEFKIIENKQMSLVERLAVNEAFRDPRTFLDMNFYDGVEDLLQLEEYGADVRIKTNSLSPEVIKVKQPQILDAIHGLRPEAVEFGLVNEHTAIHKETPPDILIFADDSPYYVQSSLAKYNILPRMPYNQTEKASKMMASKTVYPVTAGDMKIMYQTIIELLHGVTWC